MHNRAHVGTHAINQQMHANFTGHVPVAGYSIPLQVDDNHVRRLHRSLAETCRRHQNSVVFEPHRKIPVHSRHEAPFVQHPAKSDDFFPVFSFRGHSVPCRGR